MKINIHPSFLQVLYLTIIFILFSFIIYTPTFISGPVHITKKMIVEEETIEGTLLGILFIVSILILNLYKREVIRHKELIHKINIDKQKVEKRLYASDQYIGTVNVQIQEINSIYNGIDNYPTSKTELKKTFKYFGMKILGIIHSDWTLIRIINCSTMRTISEHFEKRDNIHLNYPHISNKMIVENKQTISYTSIIYHPKNLNILVFCILPVEKISNDERIFIQAIIDEVTKLYVIINSIYFKTDNNIQK